MAKKLKVSKTQAVHDYLLAHPGAMPVEIVAALKEQGIKMSRMHVSAIKTKLKKTGTGEKATKQPVAAEAPVVVEKPTTNGGTITLEQIKKVAHTITMAGGYQRVTEVLDIIKELGVKKFRDIKEAMAVEGPYIPF